MPTNSYQELKNFLFNRLSKHEGALSQSKVSEEIESVKKVIEGVGNGMFARILSIDRFTPISDTEWLQLSRELEFHFDVKMAQGILIQGEEQQERDTLWWTSVAKQQTNNYYWDRYEEYLKKHLPPEVIKTIDVDTDIVMNNIENPTVTSFSRYGMVVGHVQSGKTGNYSALICKAADAGYKFIVVIAGGINNLRNQTQERLNESFIGQTKGVQVGAGKGHSEKETLPLSLTTVERDFNRQDADRLSAGLNFDNISVPVLLVIKKNSITLGNVIDWLENQYKNKVVKHSMLVIDDESDYASINTKEEDDPTAINKKLRLLLGLFQKSAYVAYTATPYANIFIDHEAENEDLGRDLFPKDFIYALDAPTNYFGARKIFLDGADDYLVPISDFGDVLPMNHKIDLDIDELPPSLLEAMRLFVLNIAMRNIRGQKGKHNSMLIHATRFTDVHILIAQLVEDYLKHIQADVVAFGRMADAERQSVYIADLRITFEKYLSAKESTWASVLKELTEIIESVIVREVHQRTAVPLEYRKDIATNAIVVGGTSLARGYTLEGLSISYFLRSTVFYDTLMQMGRWFGYRPGYEDLCRIFMPADRISDFADIILATEELFRDFKLMAKDKRTPNDFGLAVQENPDSILQITARNKQKNVREFYFSMRLDGRLKETSYLRSGQADIDANIEAVRNVVASMEKPYDEKYNGSYIWRRVDKNKIIPFLSEFKTISDDRLGLTSRMPIDFIEAYAKGRDTDWDVALYSGTGSIYDLGNGIVIKKEKRKLFPKGINYELGNRQVSSGDAEAIAIEDPEVRRTLSASRQETREVMQRPLLMLHIIEKSNDDKIPEAIAAFGVSFPGNILSEGETIRLKINTVFYQRLLEERMQDDSESDD